MGNMQRARQFLNTTGRVTGDFIGRADDAIQASVRDHILRLPTDGSVLDSAVPNAHLRNALGDVMFQARPSFKGKRLIKLKPTTCTTMQTLLVAVLYRPVV